MLWLFQRIHTLRQFGCFLDSGSPSMARHGTLRLADGVVNYVFHSPAMARKRVGTPVVLLGGTAQTINSLCGHHAPLAAGGGGGLLQYELRGQGRTTSLPLADCSLARHAADFQDILRQRPDFACPSTGRVDLVGFSFGGRVALAIAAEAPQLVRRVVATGVPADRGALGRTVLRAWRSALERGDLEGFMWQSMAEGFDSAFLSRHESKLEAWVRSAVAANRAEAVLALVCQTHTDDERSAWHSRALARRAAAAGTGEGDALFLVGGADRLAPPAECAALAAEGGWACQVIPGAGHSVPIEQPRLWRDAVVSYLQAPEQPDLDSTTLFELRTDS